MLPFSASLGVIVHVTVFFPTVPQPTVKIHRSHIDTVYAGTMFTLSVDISLRSVTVNTTLNVTWSRGNDVIANDSRTAVTAVSGSGDSYTASLTYSPITTSESDQITVNVSVYVGSYESICFQTFVTATETLTVQGTLLEKILF